MLFLALSPRLRLSVPPLSLWWVCFDREGTVWRTAETFTRDQAFAKVARNAAARPDLSWWAEEAP